MKTEKPGIPALNFCFAKNRWVDLTDWGSNLPLSENNDKHRILASNSDSLL